MTDSPARPTSAQTVALLGTYVPRQCGLATFSQDLRNAIAGEIGHRQAMVFAMDDTPGGYDYPPEVRQQIQQHNQNDYLTAAEVLNVNQIDCVVAQHEYGIYGGKDGSHVLTLMRGLRMPLLTTLHTILNEPSPSQKQILKEVARLSDRVVVMSRYAEGILQSVYNVPARKIAYIPHGIPDVPFTDPHFYADQFGTQGRKVLLTFGLLSPGKGIEVAIKAMPRIVEKHPEALYLILGATHPHILKNEGNAYRHSLERLVAELGMQKNVVFHNRYCAMPELLGYIGVADLYITPYPNKQQITSGTLAYAVGAGKPVVSTPYIHAEELLADGRGRMFPFGDSEKLADEVLDLLDNEAERHAMRKRAYLHGRPMIWREVAQSYLRLSGEVMAERQHQARPLSVVRTGEVAEVAGIPEVNLSHLRRLTDYTGILQHATHAVPNRHHGYCTDDCARAIVATLAYYDLTRDDTALPLTDVYLSFVHHAFNPAEHRFRNFMSFDRRWLEEVGSEDSHGRALWALGIAVRLAPSDAVLSLGMRLFQDAIEITETFISPRTWAFSLVGVHHYLARFPGDTQVRRIRQNLANRLMKQFADARADADWPWCEDVLTYDNAKVPQALIVAGADMGDDAMLARGLESLEWLCGLQIDHQQRVSLVGNTAWLDRAGNRSRFDQQPIEAMALVEACNTAWKVTQNNQWFERAKLFLAWFTGNNDTRSSLYDYQTGGCRDGLHPGGPNLNQGAESTLAWLIALLSFMELSRAKQLQDDADRPEPSLPTLVDRVIRRSVPDEATAIG